MKMKMNQDRVLKARKRLTELENQAIMEQKINEWKSRKDYLDVILEDTELKTLAQISQDYGYYPSRFKQLLVEENILKKVRGRYLLLTCLQNQNLTETEIDSYTDDFVMKFKQKGRLMIYKRLKSKNILPLIEKNNFKQRKQ